LFRKIEVNSKMNEVLELTPENFYDYFDDPLLDDELFGDKKHFTLEEKLNSGKESFDNLVLLGLKKPEEWDEHKKELTKFYQEHEQI